MASEITFIQEHLLTLSKNSKHLWRLSHDSLSPPIPCTSGSSFTLCICGQGHRTTVLPSQGRWYLPGRSRLPTFLILPVPRYRSDIPDMCRGWGIPSCVYSLSWWCDSFILRPIYSSTSCSFMSATLRGLLLRCAFIVCYL